MDNLKLFSTKVQKFFGDRENMSNARKAISDMEAEIAGKQEELALISRESAPHSKYDELHKLKLQHRIDILNNRIEGKKIDIRYYQDRMNLNRLLAEE